MAPLINIDANNQGACTGLKHFEPCVSQFSCSHFQISTSLTRLGCRQVLAEYCRSCQIVRAQAWTFAMLGLEIGLCLCLPSCCQVLGEHRERD
mmetsp:Transcript_65078/g.169109  ORF Transcript_65078/g.169109 Transcript_65078/m.169109 type:complete len:93 (-) Transcript_65078:7-285(-)